MQTRWTVFCSLVVMIAISAPALEAEVVTRRLGTAPKGGPAPSVRVPRAKPPTVYVVETPKGPDLDGKLDDEVWKKAAPMRLSRTLDGSGAAAQPAEVRLLRDDRILYVAVRAFEPLMSKLQATRRGRDGPIWSDDSIEIFLGTGGVYYHFGVNAVGSTYDGQGKNGEWNSGFKAAAGRGKSEYTLEIAIPLTKMAGQGKLPTEWIANFNRNRYVTGSLQESSWSPTYSGDSHVPSRFGRLLLKAPPRPEPGKEPDKPVVRKEDVEILPAGNGAGVVRFDLSAVPKGAKVYRADLLVFRRTKVDGRMDQAMVDVEIYPLVTPFKAGAAARASGKPLAVRGPWYDRLDATDAVKKWLSGKTNGGFFVRKCPFWQAEVTCLDIWYEGTPQKVPPQVTDVKAVHRAGQTFITWKEVNDPLAGRDQVKWGRLKLIRDNLDRAGRTRYCVYRHTRKITPGNLHQAELIATVKPLSCWNVNGRNIDRPVDDYIATAEVLMCGQWNPFGVAKLDADYGRDCVIDRLVIEDGGKPLPSGAGLYVHGPGRKGEAYYAVVTALDGVQNTKDISGVNSLNRPVAETKGDGEPVFQKELPKMPFFNYDQKRLHYVRWVAPPHVNVPSQYYNWSVGVPDDLGKGVPLELNLHRDGHSYWRTHYRIERDSIVLSPHDFPVKSWWYGYHEFMGMLRSFAQGVIQPYTERRLVAFIDWAAGKWPVDRNRVLVTGCRGGASGSGALHLGIRHPDVFNLVISGHATIDYAAASRATDRWGRAAAMSMQAVWGKAEWDIKADDGESFWPRHNMLRAVRALPPTAELPFITMTSSHGYADCRKFYELMLTRHFGIMAGFSWGGGRYLPISSTGTYPNAIRLNVRRDKPLLAVVSPGGLGLVTKAKMGSFSTQFRWRDVVDTPDRFEVTTFLSGRGDAAADVTVRRLQEFKVVRGKAYAWKNTARDRKGKDVVQSGEVTAGEDGLVTVPGVKFGGRLVITPK